MTKPKHNNPDSRTSTGKGFNFSASTIIIPGLFLVMILIMLWSLTLGRYPLSVKDIITILTTTGPGEVHSYADTPRIIVEIVRLPRILLVAMCGIGLAMSGAAMQGVFRNPLVGPEIVGVSSGASFGGVLAIMLGWSLGGIVALSFCFGLGALLAAFILARLAGRSGILGLVLAGVIISSFFGAMVGIAQYLANPDTKLPGIIYWLMGSFASATYPKVALMAGITLVAGGLLMAMRWRINLLSLDEADAEALGVNVDLFRWGSVALVALIVGAQVSVSGGVGWVGLVIPHLARMLVGPEHTRLLPASAFLGGLYLVLMDTIARSLMPQEIPIGILTAIIGTPVFVILFWKMQGKGWSND